MWRINPRFTRAMFRFSCFCLFRTGSQSQWTVAVEIRKIGLDDEQTLDALSLAFKEFRLFFKPTLLSRSLVEEHVVVVRLPACDLPAARYLESLGRRLVCFDLWHFSFLRLSAWG